MTSRTPPTLRIRELALGAYTAGPEVHFKTLKVPADRRIFAFDKAVRWAKEELTRLGEPFWWGFFDGLLAEQIAECGEFSQSEEFDKAHWLQTASDRVEQALSPEIEESLGQEYLREFLLPYATLQDDEQIKELAWNCASRAVERVWQETRPAPKFLLHVGVNCADIEALMKALPEEMDLQPEEDNLTMADGGDDEEDFFVEEEVWEEPKEQGRVLNYHPESESYWVSEEFEPSGDGMSEDVTGVPEHEAEFARREAADLAQEESPGATEDDEAAINAAVYEELAKTVSARDEALTAAGVPIPEPKKAARKPRAPKAEKAPKIVAPKETGCAETASRTLLAMKKLRELGVKDEAFAAALGVSRSSANNIVNEARGGKLYGTNQERAGILGIALDFETEFQRVIHLLRTGEYEDAGPVEETQEKSPDETSDFDGFADEDDFDGFAEDDEAV